MSAGGQAGERQLESHSVLGQGMRAWEWWVPRSGSQKEWEARRNLEDKVVADAPQGMPGSLTICKYMRCSQATWMKGSRSLG